MSERRRARPRTAAFAAATLVAAAFVHEGMASPPADDPALEARVMAVAAELRCLVCQNQTIADSQAALAVDLRNQVREMLRRGEAPAAVVAYMTDRYGDFVRYRPPLRPATWLLWYGPAALLVLGLAALVAVLRRRSRLAPQAFEPDPDEPAAPCARGEMP
ncbi:MAG: cytochrome c-type biogenesis protein CcmH [Rubrivivax sp.]|nr:cytochrome c-type biogenesis protein CcmH [Rubrivivax sp.]